MRARTWADAYFSTILQAFYQVLTEIGECRHPKPAEKTVLPVKQPPRHSKPSEKQASNTRSAILPKPTSLPCVSVSPGRDIYGLQLQIPKMLKQPMQPLHLLAGVFRQTTAQAGAEPLQPTTHTAKSQITAGSGSSQKPVAQKTAEIIKERIAAA